ncbi:MAG: polysaccharide deacetylase family protein [Chloroflexota bacterium]|nr:polysaccharide deacetylase family protein [Chloroflexota bacterium]
MSVVAPAYESPGGTVPVVVTAYNPPQGYSARLTVTANNGATVQCTGGNWYNPVRDTLSRTCYVQLPAVHGSHVLTGRAAFSKDGSPTISASGRGARTLEATGYVSPVAMSLTEVKEVERCGNTSSHVQLTFDDSAGETRLRSILRTLKANNVRGRFFFTGKWAANNPSLLDLIKSRGHLVGNHTKSHPALSGISDERVLNQIAGGVQATTSPKLLRPPYGAGSFTTRLRDLAGRKGYKLCRWTTDTYDWDGSPASVLVERVKYGDHRSPPVRAGGVILMHGHGKYTAAALQGIIDAVRAKGLSLEPLAS